MSRYPLRVMRDDMNDRAGRPVPVHAAHAATYTATGSIRTACGRTLRYWIDEDRDVSCSQCARILDDIDKEAAL